MFYETVPNREEKFKLHSAGLGKKTNFIRENSKRTHWKRPFFRGFE